MKTNALLLIPVLASALLIGSCKKEHQAVTKTIDVSLISGGTYTYTIPKSDDAMSITVAAQHDSLSTLNTDASGNTVFTYVSSSGYSGPDAVQVSGEEKQNKKGKHHGCHDDKDDVTYKFNITVHGASE